MAVDVLEGLKAGVARRLDGTQGRDAVPGGTELGVPRHVHDECHALRLVALRELLDDVAEGHGGALGKVRHVLAERAALRDAACPISTG